jgi:hypothetical protein
MQNPLNQPRKITPIPTPETKSPSTGKTKSLVDLNAMLYSKQIMKENISKYDILLTPEMAEVFLERNTNNRAFNNTNLRVLIDQMEKDEWKFTGEVLIFDINGNLINGQHRVQSVIDSGRAIEVSIVTGVEPEVFKVLDSGYVRQGADAYFIEGIENPNTASAACKFLYGYKRGKLDGRGDKGRSLTSQQLIDFYYENGPDAIDESVEFTLNIKGKDFTPVITPRVMAGFHYLFSEKNQQQAEEFLNKFYLGLGNADR